MPRATMYSTAGPGTISNAPAASMKTAIVEVSGNAISLPRGRQCGTGPGQPQRVRLRPESQDHLLDHLLQRHPQPFGTGDDVFPVHLRRERLVLQLLSYRRDLDAVDT